MKKMPGEYIYIFKHQIGAEFYSNSFKGCQLWVHNIYTKVNKSSYFLNTYFQF